MANVLDVANYILSSLGPMSAMKLQKLVYYAQAWSLVWDERPLFEEPIQAWANGPVAPRLYANHRGSFEVTSDMIGGDISTLDGTARDTIDSVLSFYGDKSAQWLSDLTHNERPWIDARAGLGPGERGATVITPAAMAEYYASL
ncbi:Panacea domain-containing protein [Hoeflea sp.]|uniref:Panacea domain-containing protein n=1 Tax=Hoeflea sp. TaxID=1940281 RepID=UPI003B527391